jgi:hypothetical protein
MKWIALALFLAGPTVAVAAIWLDERQRFSDGGFIVWLAILLAAIATSVVGAVWLFVLWFAALP